MRRTLSWKPAPSSRSSCASTGLRLFQFSLRDWGKAFCAVNHAEHGRIIELFESGTAEELSRYVTQVHWSFNWQQGTES